MLGDLSGGNFSSLVELGRWFAVHTIRPWLNRWERAIERALFSDEARRSHVVEFDMDELLRGDFLQRMQGYRIGRETGLYSANDLRKFEKLNPRTDPEGDVFLSPLTCSRSKQARRKISGGRHVLATTTVDARQSPANEAAAPHEESRARASR